MADYETKSQTAYLNITGNPIEKLRVFGNLVYSASTGEYEQVVMPDVSARLGGDLGHQDFTFDDMHEYSNLDYTLMQLSGGFDYLLSPGVTFTVNGDYIDLTDDTGWVYGNETGSLMMVRSGIRVDF